MKKAFILLFTVHFLLGGMLLPQGDFDTIARLPEMYRQCKATEDKDMGPLDFITDHLINIDGAFDAHDHGDEQKPHKPFDFQTHPGFHLFPPKPVDWQVKPTLPAPKKAGNIPWENDLRKPGYARSVFHPPAFC